MTHAKNAEQEHSKREAGRSILLALQASIEGDWDVVAAHLDDANMMVEDIRQIEATYQDEGSNERAG